MNLFCLGLLISNIINTSAWAQSPTPQSAAIAVGNARARKTTIAFPSLSGLTGGTLGPAHQGYGSQIYKTVQDDLDFMSTFKVVSAPAISTGITQKPALEPYKTQGAEFTLASAIGADGKGLVIEGILYSNDSGQALFHKRYLTQTKDLKTAAHTLANDVVTAITGSPGIFLTRITMTCDRTRKKEIYMMAFDGSDSKQVTHHSSIAFSPAFSPDGKKIAYSVYTRQKNNIRNIDLFEYNLETNTTRLLSNRKGINSGAVYSPDGKKMALTMSFLGNPEIFILDLAGLSVTRATSSSGIDVDPSFSPDGSKVTFVSSRSGPPMVFSMQTDGSNAKRLTFAGRYNASPSWSSLGDKIAFAGWLDGHFDLFTMNSDGTTIERLTKNQGNNEDPHFSPDGNFIVFSSNRAGNRNIYVTTVDGTSTRRLTYGMGNCVAPKWSTIPK